MGVGVVSVDAAGAALAGPRVAFIARTRHALTDARMRSNRL